MTIVVGENDNGKAFVIRSEDALAGDVEVVGSLQENGQQSTLVKSDEPDVFSCRACIVKV